MHHLHTTSLHNGKIIINNKLRHFEFELSTVGKLTMEIYKVQKSYQKITV